MPKFPGSISSKMPKMGTTIFTVMSKLAHDNGAINLSQGFPDFNCSEELISLVNHYMREGYNQYAPMAGVMKLREAIAEKTEKLYSAKYNPETEITIASGATQGLFTAIAAIVREGDEVIVFEPAYDSYVPAIELNGGIPIFIQLKSPDYHIEWAEVKKLINQRTRMVIINSPHNPTGSIMSAADLQQLEKLTKNTDIIILSDEVYEHIIFDGYEHQSVSRYPKLAERSFVVCSFGKTFHPTGWKIGYVAAPENLMKEYRKAHQYIVFTCNTPIQYALADFIRNESNYNELAGFYQEKRDYFNFLLKDSKFTILPSSGSYFQSLGYKNISNEKDTEFAIRLTKEIGVASVPLSVFYHKPLDNKILRFCFAKEKDTLERAAEKLMGV